MSFSKESISMTVSSGNSTEVEKTNVKVMVRVRPFLSREIALTEGGIDKLHSIVMMEHNTTVRLLDPANGFKERDAFEFDHAFWSLPESQVPYSGNHFTNQEEMFHYTGKPCVANALRGFHNTIFAYGQTGSGKTFTMLGSPPDNEGIAPRLVRYLFQEIEREKMESQFDRIDFKVELSFLEIYNEKVKDLLLIAEKGGKARSNQMESGYAECKVRCHPEKGTFVEGLTRFHIEEEDQCLSAITSGMEHRAQTSTLMNDTSSRSHAIFQLCLTQKIPLKGSSRVSIINLVDLAGSERITLSGVSGAALQEAVQINLSLSTLRRVIDILIDNTRLKKGQRPAIAPFRESLLTWVLSDSLGGNSKTMMIANVSPFAGNIEDTTGTLRYALKAKAIVCSARVNEERAQAVVNSLHQEMQQLRQQLAARAIEDEVERERLVMDLKNTEEMYEHMKDEAQELDVLKVKYEEEIKEKEQELSHAQKEIIKYAYVEEERMKRTEELEVAQQVKKEAEETLKRQEEAVHEKENELAEIMNRHKVIQMHHEKSAQEGAKAKKLAERARLRQFACAFRNAFIRGKQKSGLEALKETHRVLKELVEKMEREHTEKENRLAQILSEKTRSERRMSMAQRRAGQLYHQVLEVLNTQELALPEAKDEREQALRELYDLQREMKYYQQDLYKARWGQELEKAALEKNTVRIVLELEKIDQTRRRYEQRKRDIEMQTKRAMEEHIALRSQYLKANKKLQMLIKENEEKEIFISGLYKERAELLAKQKQIQAKMARHKDDLNVCLETLRSLTRELESLRKNHAELRAYVDSRFFLLPQCANIGGVPGYYSPQTPRYLFQNV